jgi:hypothetical protein
MVACIDFFEMSEICWPNFIVRHSTYYILVFCHLQQLSPFKLDAFKNLLLKILSINVIKE